MEIVVEKLLLMIVKHLLTEDAKKEFLAFLVAKGVAQPLIDLLALVIGVAVDA